MNNCSKSVKVLCFIKAVQFTELAQYSQCLLDATMITSEIVCLISNPKLKHAEQTALTAV